MGGRVESAGVIRPVSDDDEAPACDLPARRTLQRVKIPIACTLAPSDARSQLGEWQDVLRRNAGTFERVSPNRLEFRLVPDADVGSVIDLAQREAVCCTFFEFTMVIRADHVVFAVEVPNDAVDMLDQLVSDVDA